MSNSVRTRLLALPALIFGVTFAACDDVTAPAGEFDARSTANAMQDMVAATQGMEDAFLSMELASPLFASSSSADLLPGRDGLALPDVDASRRLAAASAMATFFPSNFLGVTFVWDESSHSYTAGSETGAPADGIRVVYYAVDPITHQPASPLNALGYVDLRDLSTAASDRLGVAVVSTAGGAPVTLADYYIDVSYTATDSELGVRFESVGFLSNATDQLNFDLGQDVAVSQTGIVLTQDFTMGLEGSDLSVRYQGSLAGGFEGETVGLDVTATITNGPDRVVLDLQADEQSLNGSIAHNGTPVALVTGTLHAPQFTDPDGQPLTQEQIDALGEFFAAVEGLFELAAGIFGPASG